MALTDSFTDTSGTLLEAHTADSGQSWIEHPTATAGSHVISDENRLRTAVAASVYYLNGAPASAEYDVVADHFVKSIINNNVGIGQAGRMNATAATFYHVRYNQQTVLLQWELYKFVAGTATLLGTFPQTLTVGQSYNVRLVIRDAYKAVEIDGVERIRSTDNAITAAGFAGLRSSVAETNTNGIHLDNFSAALPVLLAGAVAAVSVVTGQATVLSSITRWGVSPPPEWDSILSGDHWDIDQADGWDPAPGERWDLTYG